jgi:hypothetical protein
VVAQFNATDADLNKNAEVGFRIVSGNGDGMFDINNHTGELFTVKELDHERVTEYQVWSWFLSSRKLGQPSPNYVSLVNGQFNIFKFFCVDRYSSV